MSEELQDRLAELERTVADLRRHNAELRMAIVALMEPGMPRVLIGPGSVMIMDQAWLENGQSK